MFSNQPRREATAGKRDAPAGRVGTGWSGGPRNARRHFVETLLVAGLLGIVGVAGLSAQGPVIVNKRQEYNVKLAYMHSFHRFFEWPAAAFADANAPYVIGLVGTDEFGPALDKLAAERKARDRKIVVQRFAAAADVKQCHLIFVSQSLSADDQTALCRKFQNLPVLLVGESAGFIQRGGGVNFILEEEFVKFEYNPQSAKRTGLGVDPKFLKQAKVVNGP